MQKSGEKNSTEHTTRSEGFHPSSLFSKKKKPALAHTATNKPNINKVVTVIDIYHQPFEFDSSISSPVSFIDKRRWQFIATDNALHLYGLIGTTYTAIDGALKAGHHLDAMCVDYTYEARQTTSIIVAVADGCGGHFGDTTQDNYIANAAHIACQRTNELMTENFVEPKDFRNRESAKLKLLEITRSCEAKGNTESTTLAFAKVLRDRHNQFHCVCSGIGDCLVALYNPFTRELFNVLPGRQMYEGTTSLTIMRDYELNMQMIENIPQGYLLLVMTDGVYESICLKSEAKKKTVKFRNADANYIYYEYTLDPDKIKQIFAPLPPDGSVELYARQLMEYAAGQIEKRRANYTAAELPKLGDDASLVVTRISHDAFDKAYQLCITPKLAKRAEEQFQQAQLLYQQFCKSKNDVDRENLLSLLFATKELFEELLEPRAHQMSSTHTIASKHQDILKQINSLLEELLPGKTVKNKKEPEEKCCTM